ncbi:hypothetical protein J6590_031911 [Homalodisca vitripennis]|nr:hypothetical protein J6590_031911 [Homalodisca vitripennis]
MRCQPEQAMAWKMKTKLFFCFKGYKWRAVAEGAVQYRPYGNKWLTSHYPNCGGLCHYVAGGCVNERGSLWGLKIFYRLTQTDLGNTSSNLLIISSLFSCYIL